MKVKGFLKDVKGVNNMERRRKNALNCAESKYIFHDNISEVARKLHPGKILAKIVNISSASKDSKRITFYSEKMPLFKAGNYMNILMKIKDSLVSRSYSISSSPLEALEKHTIDIIVKKYDEGFVCKYLTDEVKVGDEFYIEVGLGYFNIEPCRDNKNLCFIAGGGGVTPFLAMLKDIRDRKLPYNVTLIYGSEDPDNILAKDELDIFKQDNIKIIHVISGKHKYDGEKGFIDKEIITKYASLDSSFFICGPTVLYDNVRAALLLLGVPLRHIRKEAFSYVNLLAENDYPKEKYEETYKLIVHQGKCVFEIKALAKESIATSLERAGLYIHTSCRSGECGACRIKVISGDFYIPKNADIRRKQDRIFNYVHSCSTYPVSNLEIKINIPDRL